MVRGTLKRRTFGRKRQLKQGCINGLKNREPRQHTQSKREFNKTLRNTPGLEIKNRAAEISSGLQKNKDWTLCRGWPPPKRKKGNGPYGRNRW
jgi:hypothetical protein